MSAPQIQPRHADGEYGALDRPEPDFGLMSRCGTDPVDEANDRLDDSFDEAADLSNRATQTRRRAEDAAEKALWHAEQSGGEDDSNWWAITQTHAEDDLCDLEGLLEGTAVGLAMQQANVDYLTRAALSARRSGSIQIYMAADGLSRRAQAAQSTLDAAAYGVGLLTAGGGCEQMSAAVQARWEQVHMVASPVGDPATAFVVSFLSAGNEVARLNFDSSECLAWDGSSMDKGRIVGSVTGLSQTNAAGSAEARDLIASLTAQAVDIAS